MLVSLGWIIIGLSTLLLCTLYIVPILYWKLFEINVKLSRKTRKLHLKGPKYLKDDDFDVTNIEMKYISTNTSAMTVAQLIDVLSEQDKETSIYIMDDNEAQRPVLDIGIKDNRIIICDF